MAKIQEQRQRLEAKLKEMAEDGAMKTPPKETVAFDPPDEEEDMKTEVSANQKENQHLVKEVMPTSEDKQEKTLCKSHERGNDRSAETPRISLEDYRTRYLQSIRLRERINFTMSAEKHFTGLR